VTGLLVRTWLRRDLVLVGVWVALVQLVVVASAASVESVYPTRADQVAAARELNDDPATVALYGPVLDVHSLGELAMTKVTVLYAVVAALMFVVVVRRHTRGEEESGGAELLGGTAVSRDTLLAAALAEGAVLAAGSAALAAVLCAVGGLPVAGSAAFGLMWLGVGLVGTALGAVAAQLSASGRTCLGTGVVALGALYALRMVGDVGPGWVAWLSPFGWNTRFSAWSEPRWWLLGLYAATSVALAGLALSLSRRRDLGSGLLAARAGRATGPAWLGSPTGLVWRTHRAAMAGWSLAAVLVGVLAGALAPSVQDLLDNPTGRQLLESLGGAGSVEDSMLAAVLGVAGLLATCCGIVVVGHASADERAGRAEELLATATSRTSLQWSSLLLALAATAWMLLLTGLATGLTLGRDLDRMVLAGLAQVPAAWVVLAATALLQAVRSSWAVAGWGVLAVTFVLREVADLLSLPAWLADLSPYSHVPAMPAASWSTGAFLALCGVAAVGLVAASVRLRSRDIG
jgi:ABC-2 type transport system permease protein